MKRLISRLALRIVVPTVIGLSTGFVAAKSGVVSLSGPSGLMSQQPSTIAPWVLVMRYYETHLLLEDRDLPRPPRGSGSITLVAGNGGGQAGIVAGAGGTVSLQGDSLQGGGSSILTEVLTTGVVVSEFSTEKACTEAQKENTKIYIKEPDSSVTTGWTCLGHRLAAEAMGLPWTEEDAARVEQEMQHDGDTQ